MNFIFGLTRGTLLDGSEDILNNPYVRFVGFEYDNTGAYNERFEFELCSHEFKENFMPARNIELYAQSLCFKNRDKVKLQGSWLNAEFRYPIIGLAYCKNSTANGNWCKSKEETVEWLKGHPIYFVYQDTRVQSNIWADDELIDDHPYFGDKENYFPTMKQMVSYNFGAIEVKIDNFEIPEDEIYFGYHEVEIADNNFDIFQLGQRESSFVTVTKTREAFRGRGLVKIDGETTADELV